MASESDVRRFFAESGRQSQLDQIGIGEATRQFESGQFSGGQSGGGGGQQSAVDIAKQLFEFAKPQREAAIGTLRGGQAGITEAFGGLREAAAGQRPTIEQRYKDTLEEITKTTRGAAASEFTRRGIPLSSGLVEQTVGSRLAPQISQASTQRDVNLQGIDQLLANIGIGEQESQQGILSTIAQIQQASSGEAIGAAQNIFSTQQAARQAELSRQLQQQQLDIGQQQFQTGEERALRQDPFEQALLQAQTANQQRLAGGGGDNLDPVTQALLTKILGLDDDTGGDGNPPAFSPSRGAGSIFEQPDGSIWEFRGGRWTAFS